MSIDKRRIRSLVEKTLSFLGKNPEEVAVYFVTDKKIRELHEEFFDDPTSTDCISFPLDEEILGEVFVCPKTAITYATSKGLNPEHEMILYIIHGLLHLIGFDDLTPKDKRVMRRKEKSCMQNLGLC